MPGNSKNIRSRQAIRKALPTMPYPFMTTDMAQACGYGVRKVQGLLPSMEGVRKESKEHGEYRCEWYYDPNEPCDSCN